MRRGSTNAKMLVLLGLSMLVVEVYSSLQTDKQGPYDVALKSFEDCASKDHVYHITSNTKLRKKTRTLATVEGTFFTNISVNNDIKVRAVMQQLTPNGWKDNYMNFDFGDRGVCDLMFEFFDTVDIKRVANNLVNENGTKIEEICNLPPGNYRVEPVELRMKEFKEFPVFFYGTYRLRVMGFLKDFSGDEIVCGLIYCEVLRKLKNKG